MYVRNSSKKRKYLIVKLFGTRSCDGSLYVCCCRYNSCINSRDVHIMHDRFTPTSTEAREEARDIKPDKTEAWKRRRKKPWLNHRSLRPTPESPAYTGVSGPATPESPDRPPDRPQHPTRGQSVSPSGDDTGDDTGVSGLDRSLRPPTPESPACTMGLRAASWAFGPCTPLARPNPSFIPKLPLFMWMAYK